MAYEEEDEWIAIDKNNPTLFTNIWSADKHRKKMPKEPLIPEGILCDE